MNIMTMIFAFLFGNVCSSELPSGDCSDCQMQTSGFSDGVSGPLVMTAIAVIIIPRITVYVPVAVNISYDSTYD